MSDDKPAVVGIILAAGQSRRMGMENKLLRVWREKPLVQHVFDAAKASALSDILVVTGHEAHQVQAALPDATTLHNPRYEHGMGTSIACGVRNICEKLKPDGVMILLGDMPLVQPEHVNAVFDAFADGPGSEAIICATNNGQRGNPVLFGARWFRKLKLLSGDQGARGLIQSSSDMTTVEIGAAASIDFDTQEAFTAGSRSNE